MLQGVYCIFDIKAKVYGRPFFESSDVVAVRAVRAAVCDVKGDSMLSKFPADFRLFKLAEYDDAVGCFTQPENPILLCECVSLMKE